MGRMGPTQLCWMLCVCRKLLGPGGPKTDIIRALLAAIDKVLKIAAPQGEQASGGTWYADKWKK